ncbi:Thiosulfate dehydrogenase [quinone] small subunit [Metallosphaera sp. J1]|uniref:thiosulfate:quinone oxidoreductase small subunit n=1 Tax=Metallosphaera javensis (ex Hofmann et al. 2022) TaxID=99938 RepID=UPI001EDF11C3|nr:thiosulfate:quinone oxidoreductase small subunit [Metallosphaera javensis (ex Hofmann et al. 2022)]MCG3109852.1 Thiosulfate dehydrogenase [quinone] small subunit [Metallosphaera javensis (ex Hofmann et al. 2022)]
MDRTAVIALVFGILVMGFILGTGQWAYGNVVGPLVNYSKLPKLEITYITAKEQGNQTMLIMNITDVDGPDAYPASAPLMEIYNSTWHAYLNSSEIANYTIKVIQAPWNENKKDYVNWYTGFAIVLGSEAQFQMLLPIHLSPGTYHVKLYTPALSEKSMAVANFTIS